MWVVPALRTQRRHARSNWKSLRKKIAPISIDAESPSKTMFAENYCAGQMSMFPISDWQLATGERRINSRIELVPLVLLLHWGSQNCKLLLFPLSKAMMRRLTMPATNDQTTSFADENKREKWKLFLCFLVATHTAMIAKNISIN